MPLTHYPTGLYLSAFYLPAHLCLLFMPVVMDSGECLPATRQTATTICWGEGSGWFWMKFTVYRGQKWEVYSPQFAFLVPTPLPAVPDCHACP